MVLLSPLPWIASSLTKQLATVWSWLRGSKKLIGTLATISVTSLATKLPVRARGAGIWEKLGNLFRLGRGHALERVRFHRVSYLSTYYNLRAQSTVTAFMASAMSITLRQCTPRQYISVFLISIRVYFQVALLLCDIEIIWTIQPSLYWIATCSYINDQL